MNTMKIPGGAERLINCSELARKKPGPVPLPNSLKFHTVGMREGEWAYLNLWPGKNPTARLRNLLDYVQRMRPNGPDVRPRNAKGQYSKPEKETTQ